MGPSQVFDQVCDVAGGGRDGCGGRLTGHHRGARSGDSGFVVEDGVVDLVVVLGAWIGEGAGDGEGRGGTGLDGDGGGGG